MLSMLTEDGFNSNDCNRMINDIWEIDLNEHHKAETRQKEIMRWTKTKISIMSVFNSALSQNDKYKILIFTQKDINKYITSTK
jgi:hypothetical protein